VGVPATRSYLLLTFFHYCRRALILVKFFQTDEKTRPHSIPNARNKKTFSQEGQEDHKVKTPFAKGIAFLFFLTGKDSPSKHFDSNSGYSVLSAKL